MAVKPIRKVCLIQPEQPMPNMLPKEFVVMPRYGVPLIATICKNAGYETVLFVEEIRPIDWEVLLSADAIAFHALTCNVGRMFRIIEQVRLTRPDVPVIVGGTHGTYYPESLLQHCDYVVRGEGDETIVDLLDALSTGRDVATVKGVTFHRDGETVHTPDRAPVTQFETITDLSTIHGWRAAYRPVKPPLPGLVAQPKPGVPIPLMTVQSTRGCPYNCRFCPVKTVFGKGYRKRDIDSIIADLKDKLQYSSYVMFVDNLFEGDLAHATELLKRIIDGGLRASYTIFCRSSVAKHPELLKLMRRAGVTMIFLGIESLNQASLDAVNKRQSAAEIGDAIRTIRRHGMDVLASMIMGLDTDTPASLKMTRRMLVGWHISRMSIFALWGAYPEEGGYMVPPERWILKDWEYANGSFVCHFPMNMKPSTLQREIMKTYDALFTRREVLRDLVTFHTVNAQWRWFFRQTWLRGRPAVVEYIPYLEEIEKGYYDADEHLITDKLKDRADLPWVMDHLR